MKVQTNSKSEPKFPKRDDSKLFYFLSQRKCKSGSKSLKIWTREKERTAQIKSETEL